jgi:gamma-glutamyltranspeptidase
MFVEGQNIAEAISAPRWVLRDGVLRVEEGVPDLSELSLGLPIESVSFGDETGHAHAIRIGDGFEAAVDPRSDGEPVGY